MDYPKSVPNVGLVNGQFVDENVGTGQPGSLIPSSWGNAVTREILSVVESTGVEPDETRFDQLLTAINKKVSGVAVQFASQPEAEEGKNDTKAMSSLRVFQAIAKVVGQGTETAFGWFKSASQGVTNAGTNDATVVTPKKLSIAVQTQAFASFTTTGVASLYKLTPVPALAAYQAGQRFNVTFHVASTVAPAIGISSLAAALIKQYDNVGKKVPAVIAAGQIADIVYDGTDFVLVSQLPTSVQSATETVSGIARNATQLEVISGTDDTLIVTPKKLVFGFNRSFGTNGYIAFPAWLGGWIVQWGLMGQGEASVNFPIAFPNGPLGINLTPNISTTSVSAGIHYFGTLSKTAFTRNASYTDAMRWITWGN